MDWEGLVTCAGARNGSHSSGHCINWIVETVWASKKEILLNSDSMKPRPTTVTEYINAAPKETRAKLREMRAIIRSTAKGATESLKWGMPSYSYKRILVTFALFKHHIGFFPTPSAVKAFEKDLTNFKYSKGGIQFPLEK